MPRRKDQGSSSGGREVCRAQQVVPGAQTVDMRLKYLPPPPWPLASFGLAVATRIAILASWTWRSFQICVLLNASFFGWYSSYLRGDPGTPTILGDHFESRPRSRSSFASSWRAPCQVTAGAAEGRCQAGHFGRTELRLSLGPLRGAGVRVGTWEANHGCAFISEPQDVPPASAMHWNLRWDPGIHPKAAPKDWLRPHALRKSWFDAAAGGETDDWL